MVKIMQQYAPEQSAECYKSQLQCKTLNPQSKTLQHTKSLSNNCQEFQVRKTLQHAKPGNGMQGDIYADIVTKVRVELYICSLSVKLKAIKQ
jgi:hypothetical protein